jgi:hypothetical protein
VHVAGFPTDEGLIHFDFAVKFASKEIVLHCKANPMEHEPSRFLSNLEVACNLVAAHSILTIRKHPRCGKPFIQTNRGILKDSPNLDRELPLRVVASTLPVRRVALKLTFCAPQPGQLTPFGQRRTAR